MAFVRLSFFLCFLPCCCQPPKGPFAALGSAPVIQGQIEGWDRGEDYVVSVFVAGAGVPPPHIMFQTAAISVGGNFVVQLPDADALEPYIDAWTLPNPTDCSKICPSGLKGAFATFKVGKGNTIIGDLSYKPPSPTAPSAMMSYSAAIEFVYVDQQGDQTGHCQDKAVHSLYDTYVDISYQAGWNVVISSSYIISGTWYSRDYSVFAPANAKWIFYPSVGM